MTPRAAHFPDEFAYVSRGSEDTCHPALLTVFVLTASLHSCKYYFIHIIKYTILPPLCLPDMERNAQEIIFPRKEEAHPYCLFSIQYRR